MNDPYSYVTEFKRISVSLTYERIFGRIYGTQIKLLQFLATVDRSANLFELSQFHGEHVSLTGNTNTYLTTYIDFVRDSGLILEEEKYKTYRIKQYGKDFLAYIALQYPENWHQKPQ